jgi:hypothetical protein
MVLGLFFIGYGIFIERKNISVEEAIKHTELDMSSLEDIKGRLDNIEDILFNYESLAQDEKEVSFEEVLEKEKSKEEIIHNEENIDVNEIISKFISKEYTLEDTCKILNKSKGEVLLLKNLYKNSRE